MGLMDWVYLVSAAAGFLGGVGVAWGVNRAETIAVRRDLERLRADFRDFQKETRDSVQKLLILRIRNGHVSPPNGPE